MKSFLSLTLCFLLVFSFAVNYSYSQGESTFEDLEKMIKNEKAFIKKKAIREFAKKGDVRAVPIILKELDNKDNFVVRAIYSALGSLKTTEGLKALASEYSKNEENQRTILTSIGKYNTEEFTKGLIEILNNKDYDNFLKERVIQNLKHINSEESIQAIIKILDSEQLPSIKTQAVLICKKQNIKEAMPILVKEFKNFNLEGRLTVLETLFQHNKELLAQLFPVALDDNEIEVNMKALGYIGRVQDKNMSAKVASKLDVNEKKLKRRVIDTLGKLQYTDAIDKFIEITNDPEEDENVVASAIYALGNLQDPKAYDIILKKAKAKVDPGRHDIKIAAVRALGFLGDTRAVPHLIDLTMNVRSQENVYKETAIISLGDLRDPKAVERLSSIADLRVDPYSVAACIALGKIGNEDAVYTLTETLRDPEEKFVVAALKGLEEAQSMQSFNLIIDRLQSNSKRVRRAADEALCAISGTNQGYNPEDPFRVRKVAKNAWIKWFQEEVDKAVEKLNSDDLKKQREAMKKLSEMAPPKALEHALANINNKDEEIRFYAIKLAGLLRKSDAVQPLIDSLNNSIEGGSERINIALIEALCRIGDSDSSESISKCLQSENQNIKLAAIRALGFFPADETSDNVKNKLSALVKSKDSEVKKAVITAIVKQNQEGAAELIAELFNESNEEDPEVRLLALQGSFRLAKYDLLDKHFLLIEKYVYSLRDSNFRVRAAAIETLMTIAQGTLGYDPSLPLQERLEFVKKWDAWWTKQKTNYENKLANEEKMKKEREKEAEERKQREMERMKEAQEGN